jgi:hypothetical protein
MKLIIAATALVSTAAWPAEPRSPALEQYMAQLQCVTKLSFHHIDAGVTTQAATLQAAESCTPLDFKAETAGLPDNFIPSTRAERIASQVRSVRFRMLLCARQNLSGARCVDMFRESGP